MTDKQDLEKEYQARAKSAGRESRLSFTKFAEHQLRRELKEVAMEKCQPEIGKFAECAQEKGLMVIWSCSSLHNAVRECLAVHNSEEKWEAYKLANEDRRQLQAAKRAYEK